MEQKKVALLADAATCAAIGGASKSWWYAAVAQGRAPKPTIKQHRFTRWRLQDAEHFWLNQQSEPEMAARVDSQAKRAGMASAAARKGGAQ